MHKFSLSLFTLSLGVALMPLAHAATTPVQEHLLDSDAFREPAVASAARPAGAVAGGGAHERAYDEHFRRFYFLVFYGILHAIRDDRYCPLQIYPCKLFLTLLI